MANGKILQIDAPDASDENHYVQSLTLNSQDYNDGPWIPWNLISEGATLHFSLGASPNTTWGTAVAPPSFNAPNATGMSLARKK
jgi:putative alpha-1,2-mannosidase